MSSVCLHFANPPKSGPNMTEIATVQTLKYPEKYVCFLFGAGKGCSLGSKQQVPIILLLFGPQREQIFWAKEWQTQRILIPYLYPGWIGEVFCRLEHWACRENCKNIISGLSTIDTSLLEDFLTRSSASFRHLAICLDGGLFRLMPDFEDLQLSCGESDFKIVRYLGGTAALAAAGFHQPRSFSDVAAAFAERKKEHEDDKLSSAANKRKQTRLVSESDQAQHPQQHQHPNGARECAPEPIQRPPVGERQGIGRPRVVSGVGPEDERRVCGSGWGNEEGEGGMKALGSSGFALCTTMCIGPVEAELYAGGGEGGPNASAWPSPRSASGVRDVDELLPSPGTIIMAVVSGHTS
ncbi:hypothetical protein C8F04DRAFT_1174591 [Mycena alexandri]|uniref:Uncharacterized protein n=1 Tax=Mycena alexandri TaxID=1745969 RepID=A0AAD6TF43_9AGAR|nr:hypothetical protein C8F04DRAFT_1174591 [Mycena alexandri]